MFKMDGSCVVCRNSNSDSYVASYQRYFEAADPHSFFQTDCKPSSIYVGVIGGANESHLA